MQVLTAGLLALRILSQNIRYAADPPSTGEALWPQRLPDLLTQFRYQTDLVPQAFIGMQEVLDSQLTDILSGLNSNGTDPWAYIGVGRDDGVKAGEYSPILYRPSIWELQNFSYFWLSETPDRPSLGWDAGSIRVVTIGIFNHIGLQQQVVAVNTHLDNAGTVARRNGATLIVQAIEEYLNGTAVEGFGPLPVYLSGDMNSNEDDEAYGVFTSPDSPLVDVKKGVPPGFVYGYDETFTGFNNDGEGRLDYIFAANRPKMDWKLNTYATLPNIFEDGSGIRWSDHRAVVADIELLSTE